jgi:hypothetical protein
MSLHQSFGRTQSVRNNRTRSLEKLYLIPSEMLKNQHDGKTRRQFRYAFRSFITPK